MSQYLITKVFKSQVEKKYIRKVSQTTISWAQSPMLYSELTIACVDSEALYAPGKLEISFISEGHKCLV